MTTAVLTGASSFTGLWIAEALAAEGMRVIAPVRRAAGAYEGLRARRLKRIAEFAEVIFEAPVESPVFRSLVSGAGAALMAHHAADIPGYRSPDYDPVAGVSRNMRGVPEAIEAFARAGGRAWIATGTYFEQGQGGGEAAASPYGLSKGLTNAAQRDLARAAALAFGEFVIPAPFGVWEEGRIVWSMFQAWTDGRPAEIRTPAYVRDHLPAPLLAEAYRRAARTLLTGADPSEAVFRPSGFVEPVGAFAERVAREVRARTSMACEVIEHPQAAFPEPERRANDEPCGFAGRDEAAFWDAYVAYYEQVQAAGLLQATPA